MNQNLLSLLSLLLGMVLGGQGGQGGNPFSNLFGNLLGGGSGSPGGGYGGLGNLGGGPSGSRRGGNPFGGGPVNGGQFTPGQGVSNGNALDIARSYLGINERQHGGFINRTFSQGQNRPWCADFVSTVLKQAGGSPWGHIASVRGIHDWAARNGRLTNNPRPGDVILLRGARGNLGHTGFVEKIENGYVHTIEGNTSDAVKRRRYRLDSREVQGFVSTGQHNRMIA